jgi:cytochrome c5
MMTFIKKLLASTAFRILAGIVLLLAIAFGIYTGVNLQRNLKAMDDAVTADTKRIPYYPDYPATNMTGRDPALVKRGEYLVKGGDCIACHTNTPEKGKTFAGGLAFPTPFGKIYSPNLTPDKETGIGNWTDAEFEKAMRHGIAPDGSYYYPAFPFYYLTQLSRDDIKAIRAYLDSIPAVHQPQRANTMAFPFNIRFLQLGWRIMFFHPKTKDGYENDARQSAQWNRGAYLVKGLGHCSMCHTPSYYLLSTQIPLAAPIQKYDLTGAQVQGYLAPNISKSNLGNTPDAEIVDVFLKDKLIGGGNVVGPMLEVNHDSLRYLEQTDLEAIAVYIKTVNSKLPPKPKSSNEPGAATYDNYCSGCHASGAGGAPRFGDKAAWDVVMKSGKDKVYDNAIHGINGMPAKGTCGSCTDDQIKQAVDYMLKGPGTTGAAMEVLPPVPKLTMADGKRIYETSCSSCHAEGTNGAPRFGDMTQWETTINAGFIDAYENIITGRHNHPVNAGCPTCSDAEIKAALKYVMQENSHNNYSLW